MEIQNTDQRQHPNKTKRILLLVGKSIFLFFLFSIYVSYIGIVNLGFTGFFFSIPFLSFLVIASFDKRYGLPSRMFLVIFLSLYVLKHMQTTVFFPAIGRELYLIRDSCLEEHQFEHSTVWISQATEGGECHIKIEQGVIKVLKMNKGSKLIVSGTKVRDEVGTNEKYVLLAQTPLGLLEYQVPTSSDDPRFYHFAKWKNGKDVIEADMVRNIFKSPSEALWNIAKPFQFVMNILFTK